MGTAVRTERNDRSGILGLTVVELLIILAALAIVILVAVPGTSMVVERLRLKSASAELVSSLNLARTEAVRRGSTVRVCPSSNGRFCRKDGDWDHGWLVYTDGNADGVVQDIELIEAFQGPNEHILISASGAAVTAASFTVSGLVQANDTDHAEFLLCHEGSGARPRRVTIDSEGWVSLSSVDGVACSRG